MIKQSIFNYNFTKNNNDNDLYINKTNINAYDEVMNNNNKSIFLTGPKKSGKSLLSQIWANKNHALKYDRNLEYIIKNKKNVLFDNIENNLNEEDIFHIINHSKTYDLNILINSNYNIDELNIKLPDLLSRLKIFSFCIINKPDDDMLLNILTKLFIEKQFIINSNDIFNFIIRRSNRSYENIINMVDKLDNLSLEKKRQLTIPLIKEIL
tara:strand:- start:2325 stop:2954 length:630 start_codon:yes stop_codon:yes gene_type:complete